MVRLVEMKNEEFRRFKKEVTKYLVRGGVLSSAKKVVVSSVSRPLPDTTGPKFSVLGLLGIWTALTFFALFTCRPHDHPHTFAFLIELHYASPS